MGARCWQRMAWFALACAMVGPFARAQNEVAFARARHLQHGVNLSMWYAQSWEGYAAAREVSFTHEDDFLLVRSLGFDHVRLSINPEPLIVSAADQPLELDQAAMARLDATVHRLTILGLAVVLDIHPEKAWEQHAMNTSEGTAQLLSFWKDFAQHYAVMSPELVYFEVMNEPESVDAGVWADEQAKLVAAIRVVAPRHTIIATGANWGGIDALVKLAPLPDANVIYSFHDYEPMEFTHQGATWSSKHLIPLRGVPYPSTPENVAPLVEALSDPAAQADLAAYGAARWGPEKLQAWIAPAVAWGRKHRVPVWCGEFGVYRDYAPKADRARWISDMRTALEANGVGWDMWDYQGSFGMVTKKDGVTTVDDGVVAALGLKR